MTISVAMVVENGERYLKEALDSILVNALPDMQTVIFDGDSTDRTRDIAATHPLRPILKRQHAKGIAAAVNQAIAEVSGEWLAFIDCDDVWPAGRMAALWAAAAAGNTDWVFGRMMNTSHDLQPLTPPQASRMITASLVHRSVAERVGPLRTDITHGANIDWAVRAQAAGERFTMLDDLVLLRRIHGDNMGITGREKAKSDLFRILRDHLARSGP